MKGKSIVVGVSGGIAAYKVAEAVSRLRQAGADVHVVMTSNATRFVGPITFQSLSGNPVHHEMFAPAVGWSTKHIALADLADLVLIAPATANVIGKLANGIADDLLTTVVMATRAPVLIAPSMNVNMYDNPIVRANLDRLKGFGYRVVEPDFGYLACGYVGRGRLAAVDDIIRAVEEVLAASDVGTRGRVKSRDLEGKKVLVTAGPTREHIDPVRFISNPSTGKMGFAIAEAAAERGAAVVVISGPVSVQAPRGVETVQVTSAQQMFEEVMDRIAGTDVFVGAAAVSDYRPVTRSDRKLKKGSAPLRVELEPTPDIIESVARAKGGMVVVGFAAETHDALNHGWDKLRRKNLDIIVVNDVTNPGAGFGTDTNSATILDSRGGSEETGTVGKRRLADIILDKVVEYLKTR